MPSPATAAARPCSRRSTGATCSWSRSTTAAGGTATTTSSPTCCRARLLGRATRRWSRSCTGGRATGTRRTASRPRRSATRWPAGTSSGRRTWWSWRSPAMRRDRQEATLRGWLEALPDELLRVRPVLSNGYAGALLATGELEGVERRLRDAERWLDAMAEPDDAPDADGRRGRGGVPPAPGRDRRPPRRPGAGRWATSTPRSPTPGGRSTSLAEDDDLGARGGRRAARARVLGERRPRGGPRGVRRLHGEPAAGRPPLRRPRCSPSRWRTSGSPRAVSARRCAPTSRRCSSRPRGRAGAAGDGRHARRDERAPPRARTTSRPPGSTCCAARSWASTTGCRRTAIAGASRWPGSARPRETSTARSTCSTRRSACTSATSPPTCARSPALRARVWIAQGRLDEALDWARDAGPVRRRRPQLPARVRAHHPGQGAPRRRRPTAPSAPSTRRPGSWSASSGRRGRGPDGSVIEILVLQALALPAAGRRPGRAGAAGARPGAGRAGGLRPHLRRRGPADGGPAATRPPSAGSPRPTSAGCWPPSASRRGRDAAPGRSWSSR